MTDSTLFRYTPAEEAANAITHGIAAVLAVAGLTILVARASIFGGARDIAACAIFGASMVVLYTVSALYHATLAPLGKRILRVLDHSSILLLIAGSYTPFCLMVIGGAAGWAVCIFVWIVSIAGIVLQPWLMKGHTRLSIALYLAVGWAVVAAIKPLVANAQAGCLVLLVAGGLAYTVGVVFYAVRSIPFGHAVWHLFVLAGTALHYFAVLFYALPGAAL